MTTLPALQHPLIFIDYNEKTQEKVVTPGDRKKYNADRIKEWRRRNPDKVRASRQASRDRKKALEKEELIKRITCETLLLEFKIKAIDDKLRSLGQTS